MSEENESARVAAREPIKVELEAGKDYWWCTCGRSAKQPFCDGSHAGTQFTPQKFTPEHSKAYFLCQCKATGNSPLCDGAHNKLPMAE